MSKSLKHTIGAFDGTMIVAGSIIGSGIFIVSADISRNLGASGWIMAVWIIAGILTMIAATSYGELSSMMPASGGQYVYLSAAYGRLPAFVFGWSFFSIIQTATIAAVAVAFSKFAAHIFPVIGEDIHVMRRHSITINGTQCLAALLILVQTLINTTGVKNVKRIQNLFTVTKLLSLLCLVVGGLMSDNNNVWDGNWQNPWVLRKVGEGYAGSYDTSALIGALAVAMVGTLFSFDSWNNITFLGGEIRQPKKNIPFSLVVGVSIVLMVYLLVNLIYLKVLTIPEIATAKNDTVAISAAVEIFGHAGTNLIAIAIMVSTFGCNNGLILSGARVYYSMAIDGLFPSKAANLNAHAVPSFALWVQAAVACVWCFSGRYGDLLEMISFVVVFFYAMTIAGLFVLRIKMPNAPRTYKALGYPVIPAIYIVSALTFCLVLFYHKPGFTVIGILISLMGIPLYYAFSKKKPPNHNQ